MQILRARQENQEQHDYSLDPRYDGPESEDDDLDDTDAGVSIHCSSACLPLTHLLVLFYNHFSTKEGSTDAQRWVPGNQHQTRPKCPSP
jgi:hypothetical protein